MIYMNTLVSTTVMVPHHHHHLPNIQVLIMQPMKALRMSVTIAENIIPIPPRMLPQLMQVSSYTILSNQRGFLLQLKSYVDQLPK